MCILLDVREMWRGFIMEIHNTVPSRDTVFENLVEGMVLNKSS